MADIHKELVDDIGKKGELTVSLTWEVYRDETLPTRSIGISTHNATPGEPFVPHSESGLRVRVGDSLRLRVKSSHDGYLTVVNLGTTGRIYKMFPVDAADNFLEANKEYLIPGDLTPIVGGDKVKCWTVNEGSESAETPERILAIVTKDRLTFDAGAFRSRGGLISMENIVQDVRMLIKSSFTFGLLEAWVDK